MWTHPVHKLQSTVGSVSTTTITRRHGDHMASGSLQLLITNGDRMAMGGTAMARVMVAKAKLRVARQAMLLGAVLGKAMARAKVKVRQRRNL